MEDLHTATVVFLACEHEVAWWKLANPLLNAYCIDVCSCSNVSFLMDSSLWRDQSSGRVLEDNLGCCSFKIHYNTDGADDFRVVGPYYSVIFTGASKTTLYESGNVVFGCCCAVFGLFSTDRPTEFDRPTDRI